MNSAELNVYKDLYSVVEDYMNKAGKEFETDYSSFIRNITSNIGVIDLTLLRNTDADEFVKKAFEMLLLRTPDTETINCFRNLPSSSVNEWKNKVINTIIFSEEYSIKNKNISVVNNIFDLQDDFGEPYTFYEYVYMAYKKLPKVIRLIIWKITHL